MAKKKNKGGRLKPLNLTPAPRLRAFLESYVEENDRKSVTAVVEEALRFFFKSKGFDLDVPPEQLLRAIIAKQKKEGDVEELEP